VLLVAAAWLVGRRGVGVDAVGDELLASRLVLVLSRFGLGVDVELGVGSMLGSVLDRVATVSPSP